MVVDQHYTWTLGPILFHGIVHERLIDEFIDGGDAKHEVGIGAVAGNGRCCGPHPNPRVMPSPDFADCPDNAATKPTLIGSAARTDAASAPRTADVTRHHNPIVRITCVCIMSSPMPVAPRNDVE